MVAGPVSEDGAMGHIGHNVTLTNRGARCVLGVPRAYYVSHGTVKAMPFRPLAGVSYRGLVVGHNRTATMFFYTVNGYGGYPPGAPACAHPVTYHDVSLRVGTGRVALHGFDLSVLCEGVQIGGWNPQP
jgi:hypothetical protein